MTKQEKIALIDKEIKKLQEKLETSDDILTINAKILRYTLAKQKIENDEV